MPASKDLSKLLDSNAPEADVNAASDSDGEAGDAPVKKMKKPAAGAKKRKRGKTARQPGEYSYLRVIKHLEKVYKMVRDEEAKKKGGFGKQVLGEMSNDLLHAFAAFERKYSEAMASSSTQRSFVVSGKEEEVQ